MARPTCLYCGALLPEAAAAAPVPASSPPPVLARALLILDLRAVEPARLADALGVGSYDAAQRVRAGGYQVHRALPPAEAEVEAARIERAGVPVVLIPAEEAAARAGPLLVRGGACEGDALALSTDEGARRVTGADVFLVVRGPITRAYQTAQDVRRVRTATLEGGHRLHLHRHDDPRPLELDPLAFDFGDVPPTSLSSLLTLLGWLEQVAPLAPADDGFRRLTAALAPARPESKGRLTAAEALRAARTSGAGGSPLVLDNVEQFRAYSAWRAAVEARARPALTSPRTPMLPSA
jgi:hypothetical protein